MIWTTREGRRIPVSLMATDHIQNALDRIRRRKNWRREYEVRLELELQIRAMGLSSRRAS